MKKASRLLLALLVLPFLIPLVKATNNTIGGSLPAGSANIGTVNGSTVTVVGIGGAAIPINATLSAETTKVIGTVNISAAQTLATVTTVSAVTAITNALPAGTNALGSVYAPALATITRSSITLTAAASTVVMVADANRKSFECTALPTNSDYMACDWTLGAASTSTIIIPAGGNYSSTVGGTQTAALNCWPNSGSTLVIRCNSYAP